MYTIASINLIANRIRETLNLTEVPYNPETAINLLNGTIEYNITDMSIDASIKKCNDGKSNFVIDLNNNKPALRTKFTLAHELGHLFLHLGYASDDWNRTLESVYTDSVYFRTSNLENYNEKEQEADLFAAAFLMPEDEFKNELIKNVHGRLVETGKLASHFQVSNQAVIIRAKSLGFID